MKINTRTAAALLQTFTPKVLSLWLMFDIWTARIACKHKEVSVYAATCCWRELKSASAKDLSEGEDWGQCWVRTADTHCRALSLATPLGLVRIMWNCQVRITITLKTTTWMLPRQTDTILFTTNDQNSCIPALFSESLCLSYVCWDYSSHILKD